MFAFKFVGEALGETPDQGKARWNQAQQRLQRRGLQLPETIKVKPEGGRQKTPQLAANDAAKALALVLKEPLEEFFKKEEKLEWLRAKVQAAGGDAATVDAVLQGLHEAKARLEADARSLVMPGLRQGAAATFRTDRQGGEVLGSVLDYLRWLGIQDVKHVWNDWLREEFCTGRSSDPCGNSRIAFVETKLNGDRTPTPFTNFAGYKLLAKLCLHKSKIAQEQYDEALTVLGGLRVGDQRLHEVLDANAASSSGDARAFVLGVQEAERQSQALQPAAASHFSFEPEMLQQITTAVEAAYERTLPRVLAALLPDAIRALQLAPPPVQVNLNASSRSNADLGLINVRPPADEAAGRALATDTLLVTTYLKQKFAEEGRLSAVARSQAVQSFCPFFGTGLKTRKALSMADGEAAPMVGQLGRSQGHYRHADRPLMDAEWDATRLHREQLVRRILSANESAAARDAAVLRSTRSRSPRAAA